MLLTIVSPAACVPQYLPAQLSPSSSTLRVALTQNITALCYWYRVIFILCHRFYHLHSVLIYSHSDDFLYSHQLSGPSSAETRTPPTADSTGMYPVISRADLTVYIFFIVLYLIYLYDACDDWSGVEQRSVNQPITSMHYFIGWHTNSSWLVQPAASSVFAHIEFTISTQVIIFEWFLFWIPAFLLHTKILCNLTLSILLICHTFFL